MLTRREFGKTLAMAAGLVSTKHVANCSNLPGVAGFTTGGHTVYQLHPAKVDDNHHPVVIGAAYDGTVLCYTSNGQRLWEAQTGGSFPFDLCVADIDSDGLDEALVASSDGCVYAIDHNGNSLWSFCKTAPLFQVSAARLGNGKHVILAGGVERVLYALSPEGMLLSQLSTPYCIRHVRAGDIRGEGRDYAAIALARRGLNGPLGLMLLDPSNLHVLWTKVPLDISSQANSGRRFFSMALVDVDNDGKQDIVLSGSWGQHGTIFAYNHEGSAIWTKNDARIPNVPYRMNLLSNVRLPDEDLVFGLFGNILIIYGRDGSCQDVLTGRYAYANGAYDPTSHTYWLGSSVSGGDGIHVLHLDRPNWKKSFAKIGPVGKLARIERNLKVLKEQIAHFRRPAYQAEPRTTDVLLLDEYNVLPPQELRPRNAQYHNVRFVSEMTRLGLKPEGVSVPNSGAVMVCQKIENPNDFWCRVTDSPRQRYDLSADQIVSFVRDWEARGIDFVLGAGHNDSVYMPLSTFERVLQAGPKHFWGFEFSELVETSKRMHQIAEQVVLPVAEMCRKYGKKITFRNKDIFWNGTCYLPFWRRILLDPKYRDVFIPDMEETNCRTQELSLAGRLGLWMAGVFDRWGCRAETDNACFDRMWEWGAQQVLSHLLRHLVSRASFGASVFFNSIHQGPFSVALVQQLFPFYDMLEKGIIYVPQPDELLSVSDVCLGMRTPPSEVYLRHGMDLATYDYPPKRQLPMVFDRLDWYWGAAPLLSDDFSYYSYSVRRRMTNFLPPAPHGMVAIVPDEMDIRTRGRFRTKISTDGESFYDEHGLRRPPGEYQSEVQKALHTAGSRLPLVVRGRVHWSAARLDPTHVRVTLVDPGYLDPDDRDAKIVFQHLDPVTCTDILSGVNLPIARRTVEVRVPAGTWRIMDIEHRPGTSVS